MAERNWTQATRLLRGEPVGHDGWHCETCGHQHAGKVLAYICIGCPCQETPPWRTALLTHVEEPMAMQPTRYEHELDELREQRDELLAAARDVFAALHAVDLANNRDVWRREKHLLRAAIANTEGKDVPR